MWANVLTAPSHLTSQVPARAALREGASAQRGAGRRRRSRDRLLRLPGELHHRPKCVLRVHTLLTAGCLSSACRWGCVQPPPTPLQPLPSAPFNLPAKDGVYLVHATADYAHSLSIGQLMRHAAAVFAKCATPSLNVPHASRSAPTASAACTDLL